MELVVLDRIMELLELWGFELWGFELWCLHNSSIYSFWKYFNEIFNFFSNIYFYTYYENFTKENLYRIYAELLSNNTDVSQKRSSIFFGKPPVYSKEQWRCN